MSEKRTIDRIRESAASMTIGHESDGPITGMATISEKLYVLKERAIYLMQMADDIDPQRTRADIPNTQQLVVAAGTSSEAVQKIFLTGRELFRADRLFDQVDWNAVLAISLEVLKEAVAAAQIKDALLAETQAVRELALSPKDRSLHLPSVTDIEGRTKAFIQRTEHAVQGLFRACKQFYPEEALRRGGGWMDGFVATVKESHPENGSFASFAEQFAGFGKFVRAVRNCVEHPKPEQRIVLADFRLLPSRELAEPTIEVIHPSMAEPALPVTEFMQQLSAAIPELAETLWAYLASSHMKPLGNFPIAVAELPEGQRRDGVRYGYMMAIGGVWNRLG